MEPSAFLLILRTYLFPIDFLPKGRSTSSQTWFVLIDSISSFMAFIHSLHAEDDIASSYDLGSVSSCAALMKDSPSIPKRQRGTFPRSLLRNCGFWESSSCSCGSLPLGVISLLLSPGLVAGVSSHDSTISYSSKL